MTEQNHNKTTKKNFLIFIVDQLATRALDFYGYDFAKAPNIERLASEGTLFERAYTPCPLCQPARAAFWTGHYPHQTGVLSNGLLFHDDPVAPTVPALGESLTNAGYECMHFGKTHDLGGLRGFECVPVEQIEFSSPAEYAYNPDTWKDEDTTRKTEAYLRGYDKDAPFCCVADLNNPHNICGFVSANAEGCFDHLDEELPELPANFNVRDWDSLPKPVQHVCCTHRRQWESVKWSDKQYRQYRKAYQHYIGILDDHIGRILTALNERGDAKDTCVLLWADHGDGMGAHQLVTKHTTLYEETVQVPFLIHHPGKVPQQRVSNLVSTLDAFPTICELAGIEFPEGSGVSLAPVLAGQNLEKRKYVVSQWHTEWGSTIEPGRMLRTDRYKYIIYLEGRGEEFYDLEKDPGELENLIAHEDYATALVEHRAFFKDYLQETADPFFNMEWKADPEWREHDGGYRGHGDRDCAANVALASLKK